MCVNVQLRNSYEERACVCARVCVRERIFLLFAYDTPQAVFTRQRNKQVHLQIAKSVKHLIEN